MRPVTGRLLRSRRPGQGLVEFIIVAPLLLILLLGVVEFARAWNIRQVLTDASREAARTLVIDDDGITAVDSIYGVVEQYLARAGVNPAGATINVTGFGADRGDPGTVSIEYPHRLMVLQPLMGWTTGDATFTLRASTTMRTE